MSTGVSVEEAPSRRRSRDGCFTCKTRKVRCAKIPAGSGNENDQSGSPKCATCVRLGLECRWHAPAPGEHYIPPPKRRRKVARRPSSVAPKEHSGPTSNHGSDNLSNANSSNLNQSMGSPLQNLGDLDLNFDFDIEGDLFGFNISGEGLDFIPFTPAEFIPDSQDAETPNLSHTEHRNVAVEAQPDVEDDSYSNQATKYSQLAESSFKSHIQGEYTEVEALLSALVVRIKTVHMMGGDIQTFHSLMQIAADIVSSQRGAEALEDPSILSRRIIIRLAILDARSTCFRLGGGVLVKRLYASSSCSFIFERESQDASRTTLLNLLQADLFKVRIANLDLRLHDQPESDIIQSPVSIMEINDLYEEIRRKIDIFEKRMLALGDDLTSSPLSGDKTIDSTSYDRLIVLSALHSGLLYLIMIIPCPLVGCEKSVSAILLNQLKVSRDPSRRSSPGSLMPASLFLAGVHNTDPIKSDWILGLLEKGIKWGPYIGKTRLLLEAVLQTQSKGLKAALRDVMDQVTGRFLI